MTEHHQHDDPVFLKFTGKVYPLPVMPEDNSPTAEGSDEPAVLPFVSAEQLAVRQEETRQRALVEERLELYRTQLQPLIEAIAEDPQSYPEIATEAFYLRDALRAALSPDAEERRAFESALHAS